MYSLSGHQRGGYSTHGKSRMKNSQELTKVRTDGECRQLVKGKLIFIISFYQNKTHTGKVDN